jgi:heme O synthase-like polyprenyltransferase
VNAMIGIGLLAFGVATLNQYVERATDALMDRTKNRPLPSSRLTPVEAWFSDSFNVQSPRSTSSSSLIR